MGVHEIILILLEYLTKLSISFKVHLKKRDLQVLILIPVVGISLL